MRARFPIGNGTLGKGIWTAIWLLPKNNDYLGWAASGEIDIFEATGSQLEVAIGSIHFGGEWPNNHHKSEEYRFPSGTSIRNWHIYSIVWSPQSISWYIDNTPYARQDSWDSAAAPFPATFDKDFYLILNLAVGSNFDGEPDGNIRFPAEMQVDYVRFYRESD